MKKYLFILIIINCLSCNSLRKFDGERYRLNYNPEFDPPSLADLFVIAELKQGIQKIPNDPTDCIHSIDSNLYFLPIIIKDTLDEKIKLNNNDSIPKVFEEILSAEDVQYPKKYNGVIIKLKKSELNILKKEDLNRNFILRLETPCIDRQNKTIYASDIFYDTESNRKKVSKLKVVKPNVRP